MNELQWIVGACALVAVVGVYAWSRWQENRQRPRVQQSEPRRDPLLEPLAKEVMAPLPDEKRAPAALVVWRDALVPAPSCEAAVILKGSISGRQWGKVRQARRLERVRWIGRVEADRWVSLDPEDDHSFVEIQGLLPLVSRAGAMSELQLQALMEEAQNLADALGLSLTLPDKSLLLQRAAELDAWALQVDIIVGINVDFSAAKPPLGSRLIDYLAQEGVRLGDDGVCHSISAVTGQDRFTLIRQDGAPFIPLTLDYEPIAAVTLLLEVARNDDPVSTFRDMFALAERLALMLQGLVVDDQGERLGVGQCAGIERQLARVSGQMQSQQIPAGSPWARQLFS